MKYQLMPYVYAQSKAASEQGLPMVRALFFEFPDDPGAWTIDNQYLFGSDMMVAPMFEEGETKRDVYLPGGNWIDYQSGKVYGKGWHAIAPGEIEAVILVRDGAVLPHLKVAQSTRDLDWTNIEMKVYSTGTQAKGVLCFPDDNQLRNFSSVKRGRSWRLSEGKMPEGVSAQFR